MSSQGKKNRLKFFLETCSDLLMVGNEFDILSVKHIIKLDSKHLVQQTLNCARNFTERELFSSCNVHLYHASHIYV